MSSSPLFSFALGVATQNAQGDYLDVYYPHPTIAPSEAVAEILRSALAYQEGNVSIELDQKKLDALQQAFESTDEPQQLALIQAFKSTNQPLLATVLANDAAPKTVPEVYLKLQLLSQRLCKPHSLDLSGMFGVLPNVAWTNEGAIDTSELTQRVLQGRLTGKPIEIYSVDKFPKMLNYAVPSGVRVGDAARIRLGAYLGEGTTVMHEGFVNFNAGTEGPGMIEGRISAGVFVGAGSDLGGGCSTMGTLSGGNEVVISLGKECLVGANAGVGIPLGDRCTIEAGLYVTGGSIVNLLDDKRQLVKAVKARELAGQPDLLFRRNSLSGAIEVLSNHTAIELNEALHAHN